MQKIKYKNISFNINKNLICENISFKNKICIKKILFTDELLDDVKAILLHKKYIKIEDILKSLNFHINVKDKKNYLDIICNVKTSILNIYINIKVYENQILFISKVVSNKNLLYGIKTKIYCLKTTKINKLKLNNDQRRIWNWHNNSYQIMSILDSNWKAQIITSFTSFKKNNSVITLAPEKNGWLIKSNRLGENYNTTKITFY